MTALFLRMKLATFLTSISDSGLYPQKVSLQGLLEAPRAGEAKKREKKS